MYNRDYNPNPRSGLVNGITINRLDGSSQRFDGSNGAWAPDGSTIAFERSREIWSATPASGQSVNLSAGSGGSRPTWSPDGSKIAYLRDDGTWVMQAEGSSRVKLGDFRYASWGRVPDSAAAAHTATLLDGSVNGSSVTLSAIIRGLQTNGTVTFRSDGAQVGSPVVVTAGQAAVKINAAPAGRHLYTAEFSPADSDVDASTSSPVTLVVESSPEPSPSPEPAVMCVGRAATITGAGSITGTGGDDVIVGSSGADSISGGGGNDTICAGGGQRQGRCG